MSTWKVRAKPDPSGHGVQASVFIASAPGLTYQRAGHLALSLDEWDDLKAILRAGRRAPAQFIIDDETGVMTR